MRRLVVSEFVSLDGVFEGPGSNDPFPYAGWTLAYWSSEIGEFKREELFAADMLLLGKTTYEGFAKAWPEMKDESGFAQRMNNLPKLVVSSTLKALTWKNTRVLGADFKEEIAKLKREEGGDILVSGSGKVVNALMDYNLTDEYRLLIYPEVLGIGKRLFSSVERSQLKLTQAKQLPHSVMLLCYEPANLST